MLKRASWRLTRVDGDRQCVARNGARRDVDAEPRLGDFNLAAALRERERARHRPDGHIARQRLHRHKCVDQPTDHITDGAVSSVIST